MDEIVSERCKQLIKEIQKNARELYINVLLNTYCLKCSLNVKGICQKHDLPVKDAIIIEKQVDEDIEND